MVAGIGPDEDRLRALAAGADVSFSGWLDSRSLAVARDRSAAVLVPSRCEEACPYAVLDAIAAGVPALVSDRGGLPEMVAPEAVLPSGDADAWASALSKLWGDAAARRVAGEAARSVAAERFGEDAYYERLIGIYERVTRRGR
jgi:glycosyltransferase involved in cell wall biosynthesis